ncbi:S1 family peptidase [Marilutibacter alkalisoli]|uniref:S1 family peptidase n=1 Tax=Marilutibacter alkalisoli TaxID=2591633 RepID=A0A514BP25_9GAMM|nr:S1 family peptidase [Lysobacter alkalisoli]QDH69130.1 S1 family peptidase [Lysobacter alkalisoli]
MQKSRFKVRAVLKPLSVAILAAAVVPAFAADDVAPAIEAAMQRDLGLSGTQLAQYLKAERLAMQQEKQLAKAQGRHYAGSWIEKQADGSYAFVVASTSLKPQKTPAGVEIRNARHSLASLNAAKAHLDLLVTLGNKTPKGVYTWAVDVPSNTVTVGIAPNAEQAAIDFIARSGVDEATVRFETLDEAPKLHMDVKGGFGILRNPGDGYLYACSIGFPVRQGSSTLGFATAGHCGNTNEVTYYEPSQWTLGVRLGSYAASNFPSPGNSGPDMAWVKLDSGHTGLPQVYGWGNPDITVAGSTEAPVGAAVCRSGRTTQWRCGEIKAKNVTVTYQSGETILNLTHTSACSEGGDSGGSFITGPGQAQGVLSGGSGNCRIAGGRRGNSYFQPINPILSAYNLTLVTSP